MLGWELESVQGPLKRSMVGWLASSLMLAVDRWFFPTMRECADNACCNGYKQ